MDADQLLALFLDRIPSEHPKHMLSFFAAKAAQGRILPFTGGLIRVVRSIESAAPGYAHQMFGRMAAIKGTGEAQYEALLSILAEIYVTGGLALRADRDGTLIRFAHEPHLPGGKNPECEVRLHGHWCAFEVKAPRLIQHGRLRATNEWQASVRLPEKLTTSLSPTRPRDNPVKDFLIVADAKFAAYEAYRQNALRILTIVWDDFSNEPIAALKSPVSGLLTDQSFHRNADDSPVTYPHVDGIVIIRYQHQIIRSTRCEPLVDGATNPLEYFDGPFPPKAFLEVPGGRAVPAEVLEAINAVPLSACVGADYQPVELIMWLDKPG